MIWFAVSFLTRLPVPASAHAPSPDVVARAPVAFPLVGMAIGAGFALVALLLDVFLPWPLAVLLALAIEARATGAMHEDALADAADALGGGWDREQTLRILKDSRLGTYGTLALLFGVGLRYGATVHLPREHFFAACVLSAGAARWAMVGLLGLAPPVGGRESLSGAMGAGLSRADRWIAGAPLALPAVWLAVASTPGTFAALVLAPTFVWWYAGYVRRRLGGTTGDLLGACAFVVQVIALLALAADG